MTWTKLGDEWPRESRDLSDAARITHVDALVWSNTYGLDLLIPKRDLPRLAESPNRDAAAAELVESGWWQDCGADWFVGVHHPDWQLESSVVKARQKASAERVRRHRRHAVGDHSMCSPTTCNALRDALRNALPGTGRGGAGTGTYESEINSNGERDNRWPDPAPLPGSDSRRQEPQ